MCGVDAIEWEGISDVQRDIRQRRVTTMPIVHVNGCGFAELNTAVHGFVSTLE